MAAPNSPAIYDRRKHRDLFGCNQPWSSFRYGQTERMDLQPLPELHS
jgi:hypothetical protein